MNSKKTRGILVELYPDGNGGFHYGDGGFDRLPRDVLFAIFMHMELTDLANLALTNHLICDTILTFLISSDFNKKMAKESISASTSMRSLYGQAGLIMKKATCMFPTARRLEFAVDFYAKNGPLDLVSCNCIAGCWGDLIKVFVNGWAFDECERMFNLVCSFRSRTEIPTMVNTFLNSEPGSNREAERRLRTFYRSVFLDPHSNSSPVSDKLYDDDFSFYFDLILREHSTYHQAKLIYLLYGPMENGEIDWEVMVEQEINIPAMFEEIGQAISSLLKVGNDDKRNRTKQQLASLIEELTSFPANWTLYNYAYLLDNSTEEILTASVTSRVVNGRVQEACDICSALLSISFRRGLPMGRRMRLFSSMASKLKKADKTALTRAIARSQFRKIQQRLTLAGVPPALWQDCLFANELFLHEVLRIMFNPSAEP